MLRKTMLTAGLLACLSGTQHAGLIYKAAARGQTNKIKVILATHLTKEGKKKAINKRVEGWPPLAYAIYNTWPNTAAYLLDNGADPNLTFPEHWSDRTLITALHLAARVKERAHHGLAARVTHRVERLAIVKKLLEHGAHLDAVSSDGTTPLLYSMVNPPDFRPAPVAIREFLIKKGANFNLTNKKGQSPLSLVFSPETLWMEPAQKLSLLTTLLSVNKAAVFQDPVLHWAVAQKGNEGFASLKLLLEHDAPVNQKHTHGRTPLQAAVIAGPGFINYTKALLEHEADITLTDDEGRQAIHYAARLKTPAILVKIIEVGGNIHATDTKGWTPLHHAAVAGASACASYLIDHGAASNLVVKTTKGKRPLDVAINLEMQNLLKAEMKKRSMAITEEN